MNHSITKRILLPLMAQVLAASGKAQSIFVSPLGNDKNPGTKEKPLTCFQQAQKLVSKIPADQPVEVIFTNGIYYLPQTVKFT